MGYHYLEMFLVLSIIDWTNLKISFSAINSLLTSPCFGQTLALRSGTKLSAWWTLAYRRLEFLPRLHLKIHPGSYFFCLNFEAETWQQMWTRPILNRFMAEAFSWNLLTVKSENCGSLKRFIKIFVFAQSGCSRLRGNIAEVRNWIDDNSECVIVLIVKCRRKSWRLRQRSHFLLEGQRCCRSSLVECLQQDLDCSQSYHVNIS